MSESQVIAAEYLAPVVTAYSLSGAEQWRIERPNHRSILVSAIEQGTRFTYPPGGHHHTSDVVVLDERRVAVSLGLT